MNIDLKVVPDTTNEAVVLSLVFFLPETRDEGMRRITSIHFLKEEHKGIWAFFEQMYRKKLDWNMQTFEMLCNDFDLVSYFKNLVEWAQEDVLKNKNSEFHFSRLLWDSVRDRTLKGPVFSFLRSLLEGKDDPERLHASAKGIVGSLDGSAARTHLIDTDSLVFEAMQDIKRRMEGQSIYPFGIQGLDVYGQNSLNIDNEMEGEPRLIPGAAPRQITILTGVSGGGKSTFACHMALGLARQKRKVLYGAWEMQGSPTLQLLTCIQLGWSRDDFLKSRGAIKEDGGLEIFEETMRQIGQWIVFLENPFLRKKARRSTNEGNLDLVHGYIEDSGCDVFIADLWQRCLADGAFDAEQAALFRQQAIAEETKTHHILVTQQKIKEIDLRKDKRPTLDAIKGSSAYVEIADNVFGIYRPAKYKDVKDCTMEIYVLKQRYGQAPLGIEMQWNPKTAQIWGGKSINAHHKEEDNDFFFLKKDRKKYQDDYD